MASCTVAPVAGPIRSIDRLLALERRIRKLNEERGQYDHYS